MNHNPDKFSRHRLYMECLEHTGIKIVLGRFKNKDVYCHRCKSMILKHEEKETDVAVAVKLLEVLYKDECETAVIVSGDTDLVPAIETCKNLFTSKKIIFAFPFARKSKELMNLAPGSFVIGKTQYAKHLLPNPVKTKNGDIVKPVQW